MEIFKSKTSIIMVIIWGIVYLSIEFNLKGSATWFAYIIIYEIVLRLTHRIEKK